MESSTPLLYAVPGLFICQVFTIFHKRSAYGFGLRKESRSVCLIDKICFNIYNYLIGGVGMKEFLYNSSIENNKHYISVFG